MDATVPSQLSRGSSDIGGIYQYIHTVLIKSINMASLNMKVDLSKQCFPDSSHGVKRSRSDYEKQPLSNDFQIKFDSDTYTSEDYDVFTKGILHFIEKSTCSEVFNLVLKGRREDKEKK